MQSWHNDILIDRLEQIHESVAMIEQWCEPYENENDFLCSPTGMAMLDASILRLQIIGENVRAMDEMTNKQLFARYPEIPWKNIIGLRNIISHDYANVDYAMIVKIIKNNLQSLDDTIAQIAKDLKQE